VDKVKSFVEVQILFENAYPSKPAANEILAAYQLTPELPLPALQERLSRFLSDVLFSYPTHLCRNFLTSYRQRQGILHPGVYSYRVQFGNPFPGRRKGVSHHCVELIYLFNAFYDELKKVDELDLVSSHARTNSMAGQGGENPGNINPIGAEASTKSFVVPIENVARKANMDLAHDIQDHWIRFIFDEDVRRCSGRSNGVNEISVYGKDRNLRTENLMNDDEWVQQRKRFEILEKHTEPMRDVGRELTKLLF
jgi:hypothetical protein